LYIVWVGRLPFRFILCSHYGGRLRNLSVREISNQGRLPIDIGGDMTASEEVEAGFNERNLTGRAWHRSRVDAYVVDCV